MPIHSRVESISPVVPAPRSAASLPICYDARIRRFMPQEGNFRLQRLPGVVQPPAQRLNVREAAFHQHDLQVRQMLEHAFAHQAGDQRRHALHIGRMLLVMEWNRLRRRWKRDPPCRPDAATPGSYSPRRLPGSASSGGGPEARCRAADVDLAEAAVGRRASISAIAAFSCSTLTCTAPFRRGSGSQKRANCQSFTAVAMAAPKSMLRSARRADQRQQTVGDVELVQQLQLHERRIGAGMAAVGRPRVHPLAVAGRHPRVAGAFARPWRLRPPMDARCSRHFFGRNSSNSADDLK